jgi:large subunit ribosomal protein L17
MKHRVAGRKLGRTAMHRVAVLRNLSTELFRRERIRTTLMKAKELRPFAEKLITLSKRETLHARRLVLREIHDQGVVSKMFDTISSRYAQRPGGYTRIVKLGPRRGDNAEMAIIELVGAETAAAEAPAAPEAGEAGGKTKTAKAKGKQAEKPERAEKPARPSKAARAKDDAPAKKPSRAKGGAKPKTEAKGKAKASAATRKVGKSGS